MRVEHLLEIAQRLKKFYKESSVVSRLEKLRASIETQANSPSAENAAAISTAKGDLVQALHAADINEWPVSWREELSELNLDGWVGSDLARQIDDIVARNSITISEALAEVTNIKETVEKDSSVITQLVSSLTHLEFEADELSPGEFEISVKIPRPAVDNAFDQLGREFVKLDRIFGVFAEIVTGSREQFKIRGISTSDPTVYLNSIPAVAAAIALALERAVALYERILNIRKAHQELANSKLPQKVLDSVLDHVEKTIKDGLEEHAKSVEREFFKKLDVNRRPEMAQELRRALWDLARRVDQGYEFDVRGKPEEVVPTEEGQPPPQDPESMKYFRIVEEARRKIQYFESEDEPVLRLSKPSNDTEE
jgi:hypothetical protein